MKVAMAGLLDFAKGAVSRSNLSVKFQSISRSGLPSAAGVSLSPSRGAHVTPGRS